MRSGNQAWSQRDPRWRVINGANTSDCQHFLPDGRQNLHLTFADPRISMLRSHTFGFGPQSASHWTEKRCEMMTLLIVLLVLFLLGGGGWGYTRWRG